MKKNLLPVKSVQQKLKGKVLTKMQEGIMGPLSDQAVPKSHREQRD